ncbi:hypothetical protein MQE23_00060 [Streptomyces sp. HP-A2021]|uniref:hypothetical protein n=1 Tax=Streptomyces sp. HP-A2021 TaxID=2927875 RepID=UPI001FAF0B2F|nr:hypothetical protein [Streptomyces sp. HP-A2021]UOB07605.1 hypothetical protein MQE23_00060 [Streptomyces sp. HP-A2021]
MLHSSSVRVNAVRFSTVNTRTPKDLPDTLASGGNSLLSMTMQLSTSLGVIAGILLSMFSQPHIAASNGETHMVFIYTYLSMIVIIALPVLIFNRVPTDGVKQIHAAAQRREGCHEIWNHRQAVLAIFATCMLSADYYALGRARQLRARLYRPH